MVRVQSTFTKDRIYVIAPVVRFSPITSTQLLDPLLSASSDIVPPGKTVGTAIRKTLAQEEKAQGIQREDAESSADWLSSALYVTRVVLDSSEDIVSVVSVLSYFVNNLSSVIPIHGSDQVSERFAPSLLGCRVLRATSGIKSLTRSESVPHTTGV